MITKIITYKGTFRLERLNTLGRMSAVIFCRDFRKMCGAHFPGRQCNRIFLFCDPGYHVVTEWQHIWVRCEPHKWRSLDSWPLVRSRGRDQLRTGKKVVRWHIPLSHLFRIHWKHGEFCSYFVIIPKKSYWHKSSSDLMWYITKFQT